MLQVRVGKFGEILNARPKGMTFKDYKKARKEQTLRLKGYNTIVGKDKVHVMGRLEGILIPSEKWTNSRDTLIILG